MPQRFVLVVDLNKCNGCGSCTVACETACADDGGRRPPCAVSRVGETQPGAPFFYLPRVCSACDVPPCAIQCPARAILVGHREDTNGPVHLLVDRHAVALPLPPPPNTAADVYYVPPLWSFRENADGTVADDERRLPLTLLEATFGPAAGTALTALEEAFRRRRTGEPSELADALLAWHRRDVFGAG